MAISAGERPAERRASKPAGSASDGAQCGGVEEEDDDASMVEEEVKATCSAASAEAESVVEAVMAQ